MSRIPIQPVTRPPVEAKVFDTMWVTSLVIQTPYPGCAGRCVITYKPMSQDYETLDHEQRIESNSLMLDVSEVPAIGQAFQSILAAIPPMIQRIEERANPPQQEPTE